MSVNSKHESYDAKVATWKKHRDVLEGEDAVKAAGTDYLPKLTGQEGSEYNAYKLRALFYEAASRTVSGLAGGVLRKEAEVTVPTKIGTELDSIGVLGETLHTLIKCTLEEVIGIGRYGLLVDAADSENAIPYISTYFAENIINWREQIINGQKQLTMVVLAERGEEKGDDEFEVEYTEQRRVLSLVAVSDASDEETVYEYHVDLWEKQNDNTTKQDDWVVVESSVPTIAGGKKLNYIPFTFINPTTLSAVVERCPISGLVNANLSHYRTSADLEHGRHFTALPTAWVAGFDSKTELTIGASRAWVTDNPEARAGFLEFTGAGLKSLSEALSEKEILMAVLGARMLEAQKKGVEAEGTVKLRQAGEYSILSSIAMTVGAGFTKVLQIFAEWIGVTELDSISVKLNTDFTAEGIDPAVLTALMGGLQNNYISWDTWYFNLKRGEVYPDESTLEDERALIQAGKPIEEPGKLIDEDDDLDED